MNQTTKPLSPAGPPIADHGHALIDLTEAAANEVKRLIATQNLTNHYLRVGVQGGGCSGLVYSLHLDDETHETDRVFDVKEVKIVVDAKSAMYLAGTRIDFIQSMTGGGFKFNNPNTSPSCGCGTSFSA